MADYPRLLNLDQDTEDRLKSWLNEEIHNHLTERQEWVGDLESWQRDYWVKPSTTVRKFPFYGASNLIVPLTAISVEAVHARMMQTLFGVTPFVSVDVRPKDVPSGADAALAQYVDFELLETMKAKPQIENIVLETEKYGTGIGKSGFEKIVRKAIRMVGETEQEFEVVTKSTATLDAVPVARFLQPYQSQDPQTAPWVGEEHSKTPFEVKVLDESGMFYPGTYDEVIKWASRSDTPSDIGSGQHFTDNQERLEDKSPIWGKRIDFFEIWTSFDIDGSGSPAELQVFYHYLSNMLMGVRYNWYEDLHRPYRYANYIPVEHRWSGIGICKQNDQFQKEITTIHRQRLDNSTLANMRMLKIHKLSGYGPEEPVFPGKMWFLDDMDHIESIQMGEVYQSSYANEQSSLLYSQQRTGVNEVLLGMPNVGTPGTATGDLARIQEGNKRFDYSLNLIKAALGDMVMDAILNIKQFGTRNVRYFQAVEGGDLVGQLLSAPAELIRSGLLFKLNIAGSKGNRLLDRNSWKEIAVILQQYYVGLFQLAQVTQNPQLIQAITQKGLTALSEAMKQLLQTYEIRNIEKIILTDLERVNAAQAAQSQGAVTAGADGGNTATGSPQGLDILSQLAGAVGG